MKKAFAVIAIEGMLVQGLSLILGLAWMFIASRDLGVESMGKVLLTFGAINSVITLFGMGLQHSVAVKARDYSKLVLASNGVVAILVLGLLAALLTAVSLAIYMRFDASPGLSSVWAFGVVFFLFLSVYLNSVIRGFHYFRAANFLSLSQLASFNFLLFLSAGKLNLGYVLVSFLLASAVSCVLNLGVLLRISKFSLNVIKYDVLKCILNFGGRSQIGNALKEVMYKSDLYLVGWLLGAAEAGLYGVVLKLLEAIGRFVDAIGLVVLPVIAKSNSSDRKVITMFVVGVVFPVSVLIAMIVSIESSFFVRMVFGDSFDGSIELLRVGVIALIPLVIWKLLANDMIGRGHVMIYSISAGIGATFILVLNYTLLNKVGLVAAPWILVFSYSAAAAVLLLAIARELGVSVISVLFSVIFDFINIKKGNK